MRLDEVLRRVGGTRRLEPVVSTFLRARPLRERVRFAARELRGRAVASYRLRGSDVRIVLRHRSPDVFTLDQVFYRGHFEPPPPVAEIVRTRPPLSILDLGANIGLVSAFFLRRFPTVAIEAFEPDPGNLEILRRFAAGNPARTIRIVGAAASNEAGEVPFAPGRFGQSRVAATGPAMVEAIDVLPRLREHDLVKMDIEGSEWKIVNDARFPAFAPAALVLEYHHESCPDQDPQVAAERALSKAGYELAHGYREPDGSGLVWGWRGES